MSKENLAYRRATKSYEARATSPRAEAEPHRGPDPTRPLLFLFYSTVLITMIWLTAEASLDRSVLVATSDLWTDSWFRATLFDAYFAFLAVYVWIWFRERSMVRRLAWLLLILSLGSMAIALYFLLTLVTTRDRDWRAIVPRREELHP